MSKKILSIIILIVVIASCTGWTLASSVSDLQDKQNQTQQNIKDSEEKLNQVKEEKNETLSEIEELSSQITESQEQLDKLNNQVKELEKQIKVVEQELKEAQEKQEAQQKALEQRIVAQYKTGTLSYWEILLNPESPLKFLSNLHMFNKIAQYDNDLINSIEEEKEKIEKNKEDLDNKRSELKIAKADAEKENVKLRNAKAQKNSKLAKLSDDEKKIQEQIDAEEAELANIKKQIQQAQEANNTPPKYTGGKLAWPTPGYYTITSKYGMRLHPVYHVWKLHAGIDLGAPKGANFVAAEDGIVITSRLSSSYGNMIVIDHGGGLTTLYAHGTTRLVSVGDKVKRGQAVLTVGSTGISTGNHAHFEVRVNGSAVDPLPYLQ